MHARRHHGFSLIELMVVLSIISLLTSIALPIYSQYWMKLKRLEGRLALLEASFLLDKYATTSHQGYLGATLKKIGMNQVTEHGWYQLSLNTVDEDHYVLVANPTFSDKRCTQLSCGASGKRGYQGTGSYHDCWGG